jgi:hypothetical protein
MDESAVVHFFNGLQHLNQQLDCNLQAVVILEILPDLGEVIAKKIHYDQVLLTVFNEVIYVADVFESFQVLENVVLENQDALVLVFLFDFESHIFLELLVVCLINEAKCTLSEFLFQVESFGDLERVFVHTCNLWSVLLLISMWRHYRYCDIFVSTRSLVGLRHCNQSLLLLLADQGHFFFCEVSRLVRDLLLVELVEAQALCLLLLRQILGVLSDLVAAHDMVRDYLFLHDTLRSTSCTMRHMLLRLEQCLTMPRCKVVLALGMLLRK